MEILHSIYLGEELDVIADLDEIELLVELEDVHPAPRAPSVEDHRVPPGRRRPGSSREVVLVLAAGLSSPSLSAAWPPFRPRDEAEAEPEAEARSRRRSRAARPAATRTICRCSAGPLA
jgi:hypothetical protein